MLLNQTLGSFSRCQASTGRWLPSTAPRAYQLGSRGFASHQNSRLSSLLVTGPEPTSTKVNMLRKRDKGQNKIVFVDISSQDYSAKDNAGITYEEAMGSIHGILPGDTVITNVDVFRKLYEVVGLGWVYAITRISFINNLANRVYALWAKYRLPITGRPDIETVLCQRKETCKGS
ncbi:hypothetical protein WJX79_003209 [Trebouxia sp. C0005]